MVKNVEQLAREFCVLNDNFIFIQFANMKLLLSEDVLENGEDFKSQHSTKFGRCIFI